MSLNGIARSGWIKNCLKRKGKRKLCGLWYHFIKVAAGERSSSDAAKIGQSNEIACIRG